MQFRTVPRRHAHSPLSCDTGCGRFGFLEYTDDESIFSGSKRDDRLEELWQLYRSWCEDGQIAERAQRKLFNTAILKNNQYVEISQKVMNVADT